MKDETPWKAIDVKSIELCNYEPDVILAEQRNDSEILAVICHLETKDRDVPKHYKRFLNRLRMEDGKLVFVKAGGSLLVIPGSLRDGVLELGHTQFAAGHLVNKTMKRPS